MRFVIFAAVLALAANAQDAARLAEDPTVKAALDAVKTNEPHFIDEQIRICEIPAPPFHEDVRGKELERLFKESGLENVRIDKAGNVIGVPHNAIDIGMRVKAVFSPGEAALPDFVPDPEG